MHEFKKYIRNIFETYFAIKAAVKLEKFTLQKITLHSRFNSN